MVEREKREDCKRNRERIEIETKETKGNQVNNLKRRIRNINTCLCLFQCVSSEFLTRFCSKGEVLKLSFQRSCSIKGLSRRV